MKLTAERAASQLSVHTPTERISRIVSMSKAAQGLGAGRAAESMECNRRSRRRSTALPALMAFHNMRVTVPCTVTDMSGTGARLELPPSSIKQFGDGEHLPDRLMLVLKADRMQVECEVKWRRAGRIGVRFLAPPRPMDSGRK